MARVAPASVWVVMSGVGSKWLQVRLRSATGPAVAAVGLALLCLPAAAQQINMNNDNSNNPLLRGRVEEDEIRRNLHNRNIENTRNGQNRAGQQQATETSQAEDTTYEPISTSDGSEPPSQEPRPGASLFEDPATARVEREIFGDVPVQTGRPISAGKRAQERREQLNAAPETTAERRKRAEQERLKGKGVDPRSATSDPRAMRQISRERTGTVGSDVDRRIDPRAQRASPIEGRNRQEDENPYEAPGIRAGTFILRPSVEQGVTVTDNLNSSSTPRDAVLSETTLRLNAVSEHAGDRTGFNTYGVFRKAVGGEKYDYKEGGFDAELVRRLANEYSARGTIAYAIRPESFSSPVEVTGAASRPIEQTLNASAGLTKDMGKLRLGVTAKIDREWYGDADVEGIGAVSQEDRNSTLATVTLRGGYEISPALRPFIEVEAGRRFYDVKEDAGGFERSANRYAANTGVEVELGEKLNGEISAGYVVETLDDEALGSIGGLNLAGKLNWSPERGTIVGLSGSTEVEGTTEANSAGSLLYSGRLSIERMIRANLTANASVGLSWRDYQSTGDSDTILSGEASATWWLNRYAGITGRARHETMKSTLPDRDTRTNSLFLGLRLQR